ncbi:hypothetical protein [Leptolyngbya sp. FACHB-261]|uniref:hypothetical protein n=1 Tax=Leptolyngbya sp. FACHB-261 TaxID=2692806 RepID=UPI00168475D3|nr:hypothetical protein [Leptolyngbya sp. FACHB-261]MBD2104964.1 hypothetical protein [Leptolyngbya sp. FACHB-261]
MRSFWRWFRLYSLGAYWIVLLGSMYLSIVSNSPPSQEMNPLSITNFEGDLHRTIVASFVEIALLHLILRPWSFERPTGRTALALVLLLMWTGLLLYATTNTKLVSQVSLIHLLWLVVLNAGLLSAAVWGIGRYLHRSRQRSR